MMIRSSGHHHSSERRYKKERFRNQNFRKYQLIEDDNNSDYENGVASAALPDKRRKDVQTNVLRATHINPSDLSGEGLSSRTFDSNASENIKNKFYSTKTTQNDADAHFQWINDRFEYKTKGLDVIDDELDDIPIRIYPAYGKRGSHDKGENTTKHSLGTKSYSTKVYRNSTRKTTEPDYEHLMQPLTIATTGWTTSTSTTRAAKVKKSAVPTIVTTSYGDRKNVMTTPHHGYKSLTTDTRGFHGNRNVTATPIHGYDNTGIVNVSKEYGRNASRPTYSTTKTVYHQSQGTSVSSPLPYGSFRHQNTIPVAGYDNTRNTTEAVATSSVTSSHVARSDSNRQQRNQIIQKQDSGEYDNFDKRVVSRDTSRRQTQEYRYAVDSHEQSRRSAGSNAVRKTKQKSQTLQVPHEYVIQKRETSKTRSSERLYKTESSDDSDQDYFKLKLVGTQHVDERETGPKKKTGSSSMPVYQSQERRNIQSSQSYTTQHLQSQRSQYNKSLAVAKTKPKNQTLQVPSPYVATTHMKEKSHILQVPSEYTTVRKSVSPEKVYITESSEDSEQDDFKLELVGAKQLDGQVGIVGSHSSQTSTGRDVKNIQNRRTYSSVVKNEQTVHSIQVPSFHTQEYSTIKQGEVRTLPERQNLTQHHSQQHRQQRQQQQQQRQLANESQMSSTKFVQHMQNTQPRSNQMTEQLSRAEESSKSVKGGGIDSRMKENLVAFEESNRHLREVVEQAEKRLHELEDEQTRPKFHQVVQPAFGERRQREQEKRQQLQAKTQSSNQTQSSFSYQKQYNYQINNTRQGHIVTPPSHIQPEPPKFPTLDSTKVSTNQNNTLSRGQVSAAQTHGYTQQTMSATQSHDKKQYQKAQNLNRTETEVGKKFHEMEKNELQRGGFTSHSSSKKSLLRKQGSDEYDNLTIEDLINRDNEKADSSKMNRKFETNVGDQIYGQNLNGVKRYEADEKWLYKQEYHGSREAVGMNKDLKHDSAYYSYTTLNQDGQGYLSDETKDTKDGYDGSVSGSSTSILYGSRKQSSTYTSRSSYGQSGSAVDEGGLLYKTFKQKDNGYKRVKDNDVFLDKHGSMSDSYRRGPPAYVYRSEDGYESSSERYSHARYGDSVNRDIYSDTETLKKKPIDDKGGLFFKAVKKSTPEKDKNTMRMRNTAVKRSGRYDDDDSSSTIQSESSYKSGKEFDNSKHRDYYSRRSNLGMCCVQVKCSSFVKKFYRTSFLFVMPLISLFWTSGDISGFQSQSEQPYSRLAEVLGEMFFHIVLPSVLENVFLSVFITEWFLYLRKYF